MTDNPRFCEHGIMAANGVYCMGCYNERDQEDILPDVPEGYELVGWQTNIPGYNGFIPNPTKGYCQHPEQTKVLQPCVYDADVNAKSTPVCLCCPACRELCGDDI